MIINGAMNVAQRSTSSSVQGYATLDRWKNWHQGLAGAVTFSQDSNAPAGFNNSMKMTNASDEASLSAGDFAEFTQNIEAQDCQRLEYGTASAKVSTLSFWVRSTVTGTGCIYCYIPDHSNRQWSGSYTISSTDTWEYKTLTIPANTVSTINDDNGVGLNLNWVLLAGSTYTGGGSLSSSWEATTSNKTAYGQTNFLGGATGRIFQITGVQLELGSSATPFEHRSYGDELARCLRYYNAPVGGGIRAVGSSYGTTGFGFSYSIGTRMRDTPTLVHTNSAAHRAYHSGGYSSSTTNFTIGNMKGDIVQINAPGHSGLTDNRPYTLGMTGSYEIALSSEL
tara:strand:+ start:32 stop:1045 length:1014 start_codon:yes stop_codon:yes gene_type:complete